VETTDITINFEMRGARDGGGGASAATQRKQGIAPSEFHENDMKELLVSVLRGRGNCRDLFELHGATAEDRDILHAYLGNGGVTNNPKSCFPKGGW